MSLVGTRPILQDELQKYELHHRARIAIKPGITGMWQVSGNLVHVHTSFGGSFYRKALIIEIVIVFMRGMFERMYG